MLYSFADASDIPLTVGSDEDLCDKILEEVETNPIVKMKRPMRTIAVKAAEPFDVALKENLSAVYDAHRQTLVDGDLDAFLTTVRTSLSDEDNLASNYRKLFPEILAFYPPRTEATFVTVRYHDAELAGYFQIIHEPTAPEFETVVLIPFVHYAGQWKIIFSLDNIPRMSLLSAKSEGDKISRAFELIDMPGTILALEEVRSLFEDSLISDD